MDMGNQLTHEGPFEMCFLLARVWVPLVFGITVLFGAVGQDLFSNGHVLLADGPQADARPPWEGTYKIRPDEQDRLTDADVVGPDGIVYPDWTYAGVPGGIPDIEIRAKIEDYGGQPNDGRDDSHALQQAVNVVGSQGGGAVLLGEGSYDLAFPVTVRHDGVVIRGSGSNRTKILFRYAIPRSGVAFFGLNSGQTIGAATRVELHAHPKNLMAIEIRVDGRSVARRDRKAHWGNSFAVSTSGGALIRNAGNGKHTITGIAEYRDGVRKETAMELVLDSSASPKPQPRAFAAFGFAGEGLVGPVLGLAADGQRGSRELLLKSTEGLRAGDAIMIEAPKTERWDKLVKNACLWGTYRRYFLRVEDVRGNRVEVNQPLRLTYPVVDRSYVRKLRPIRRCGVEDLYLEQTENLWINSIQFTYGWECWARGVTVKMTGRFPCHATNAKWCEIRDCVFDDAWFKGGGGTAYVGWQHTCDCLMEDVTSYRMRHAPCYQWAASGNVIRKSFFHESDGQWHAGWTNENLFEQCVIDAKRGNGSYGYGFWGSPPEDKAHGPNGPRNVVYNCDVRSPKSGLWMGGMNENWLILHNRFIVERGVGVFAKTASFDHIIRGNAFVLREKNQSALLLATPDCIGVEFVGNWIYGPGAKGVGGAGKPMIERDNKVLSTDEIPPRPQPAIPSIFEWQRESLSR